MKSGEKKIKIFTDGGARGNPGPAAIGVVILSDESEKIIEKFARLLGETTNNVAEYSAVIEALKWVVNNFPPGLEINFFSDSKLMVSQLNGLYKIKNQNLRLLILKVKELEMKTGAKIFYHHIPREENKLADSLVNSCLA